MQDNFLLTILFDEDWVDDDVDGSKFKYIIKTLFYKREYNYI